MSQIPCCIKTLIESLLLVLDTECVGGEGKILTVFQDKIHETKCQIPIVTVGGPPKAERGKTTIVDTDVVSPKKVFAITGVTGDGTRTSDCGREQYRDDPSRQTIPSVENFYLLLPEDGGHSPESSEIRNKKVLQGVKRL